MKGEKKSFLRFTRATLASVLAIALLTAGAGFYGGYYFAERKQYALMETMATEQLGYHLAMLEWIDSNKIEDVKQVLQGSTSSQLSWIIEYGHLNTEPEYVAYRCKLIKKLKKYRKEHQLFEGRKWEYLWKVPGNRLAEDRRIAFLETSCRSGTADQSY